MKRMMSIAAIALFVAGSSAFACDTCGCKAKQAEGKKAACSACPAEKTACKDCKADQACATCTAKKDAKKACPADCAKACCAPKADA